MCTDLFSFADDVPLKNIVINQLYVMNLLMMSLIWMRATCGSRCEMYITCNYRMRMRAGQRWGACANTVGSEQCLKF